MDIGNSCRWRQALRAKEVRNQRGRILYVCVSVERERPFLVVLVCCKVFVCFVYSERASNPNQSGAILTSQDLKLVPVP